MVCVLWQANSHGSLWNLQARVAHAAYNKEFFIIMDFPQNNKNNKWMFLAEIIIFFSPAGSGVLLKLNI